MTATLQLLKAITELRRLQTALDKSISPVQRASILRDIKPIETKVDKLIFEVRNCLESEQIKLI